MYLLQRSPPVRKWLRLRMSRSMRCESSDEGRIQGPHSEVRNLSMRATERTYNESYPRWGCSAAAIDQDVLWKSDEVPVGEAGLSV